MFYIARHIRGRLPISLSRENPRNINVPSYERAKMKLSIACFGAIVMFATVVVLAQDSHYRPEGQQFPAPSCFTVKGAWEGGSKLCNVEDHDAWLADLHHWRNERLIRVGYDGSRYDNPALK